ncbi:MAG TPA: DUF6600 domain-containing protein [Steroidobacteraceae bacterium]|nr:DUF6600 domain-containing protein [Steroidobacteraceae bacterium]
MLRPILFALALTVSGLAAGQATDSPARIAQLAYVEGAISYQEANERASSALPERPLEAGDRLSTERDGRAELTLGSATVRLDRETDLRIADLDASSVRFELMEGAAIFRVDELYEDETFAVTTPNTTISFRKPGEYRVDVPEDGITTLTVRAGDAEVETAEGAVRIADGQRARIEGAEALTSLIAPQWTDDFDNWVLDREVQLAENAPLPVDEEYAPDGTLDDYGDWQDDPQYGQVWMPSYAYGGYDPFATGYWSYTGHGYAWVNPMPWGPYTNYYGHWTYLPQYNRYGWVAREARRRAERVDNAVERALAEARRQDLIPDTRPMGRPSVNAADMERRVQETSREVARRLEADRAAPRAARDTDSRPSSRSAGAAAQRNAATAAAASAARSSSSSAARSSSAQAARSSSSATRSTSKGFGTSQDP